MKLHTSISLVAWALALSLPGIALAQDAPFNIQYPPDNATVREKVNIKIPRASLPAGSVIALFIDDKFSVALPAELDNNSSGPFLYVWDTKGNDLPGEEIADGPHTIRAVLYEPSGGGTEAMNLKGKSEIKVTVANKIKGVGAVTLRYKYHEGENLEYSRDGRAVIVSALSGLNQTGDMDMATVASRLQLGVEDARPESSLVRNKLTALTIQESGQETRVDPQYLSASIYQELNPLGKILYETGTASDDLEQFNAEGLAINNTLELPLLPSSRIAPGDSWSSDYQRIDIPGMPPGLQPRVTVTNKFEGFEWDSGYQTAKIHQTYEGVLTQPINFGGIEVTTPKINYDRVIYLAYKSGTLVKVVRTMTVSGQTTAVLSAQQPGGGAPGGGMRPGGLGGAAGGGMRPGGLGGPPGAGGGKFGMAGGGMRPGGLGGPPGAGGGKFGMAGGGMRPGGLGGLPGAGGAGTMPGMGAGRLGRGLGGGLGPGTPGGAGTRPGGPAIGNAAPHPVTLKSTTITQLLRVMQ